MSIPYYPDGVDGLWIKDDIAPNGTNVYYVRKISGYTPDEDNIFKFIDNFNDNSINTSKWFTDGTGTISETNGTMYISSSGTNTYPRIVTTTPISLENYICEYNVKVTSVEVDSCRIGYTSYYIDGNTSAFWYLYIDSSRYIRFWTRFNGEWALRWSGTSAITLNTWYKIRFVCKQSAIKVQFLSASNSLLYESGFISCDYSGLNSIYFGQRSSGDSGYFDNFIIKQYVETVPTVTVLLETGGYRVIVKNTSNIELHDYEIKIPTSIIGTLTTTSSVCIDKLYKTPLTQPYYKIYSDCIMNIPHMDSDITGNHNLTVYNGTNTSGRFNDSNNTIQFNGSNTRGVIANNSDLDIFNTNNFTLILWVNQLGNYPITWCSLLAKSSSSVSSFNKWILQINKNEVGFYIQSSNKIINCIGLSNPIKINDYEWHMISFVRNGSYLYTYKDNVLMQTIPLGSMYNFSNTNNVDIGCTFASITYDNFFYGNFGEILLYSTSLVAKDIANYYNLTKYKYIPLSVSTKQF